jgi:hypothetical protein
LQTLRDTSSSWVDIMRERRYLTFDMNNPRHMEALRLFSAQPDKMRSEFVIDCILKAQKEDHMDEVIRQTILEALAGISLHVPDASETPSKLQSTESITDLPETLVDSMDDI